MYCHGIFDYTSMRKLLKYLHEMLDEENKYLVYRCLLVGALVVGTISWPHSMGAERPLVTSYTRYD